MVSYSSQLTSSKTTPDGLDGTSGSRIVTVAMDQQPPRPSFAQAFTTLCWIEYRRPRGDLKSKLPRPRAPARAMCWGWRMSKPSSPSGLDASLPEAPTGGHLLLTRLASTMSHSTWSIATGSVASKRALFSQVHLPCRVPGERAALVDRPDAVHDVQDALLADDRVGHDLGDELVADVAEAVLCDRATLLTEPWLMFLSAPVTPAEP